MERVSDGELKVLIDDAQALVDAREQSVFTSTLAAFKELQGLRSQSRWVKVSERLPEKPDTMLLAIANEGTDCVTRKLGHYAPNIDEWFTQPKLETWQRITHWMELPAAPKEGENGQ